MRALPLLLAFFTSTVWALPQGDFSLDKGKSEIRFEVTHKFHKVEGKTRKVEARALVKDPSADVMVRIDVSTFDSGNGNRDAHMMEVIEAHKFPYVEFRAKLADTDSHQVRAEGKLLFHGIEKPLSALVTLTSSGDEWKAEFSFPFKLSDFHVERPSLLFVKIQDEVQIRGALWFRPLESHK